ncbi:MAG: hypothetical protein Kow0025_15670 [Thermodesulfovibrionales bacterium]
MLVKKTLPAAREEKTWEEESGFLAFLSSVGAEVDRFNRSLGFDLEVIPAPPSTIDGAEAGGNVGFVIVRRNPVLPERTYCLYSLFEGGALYGFTGVYSDGRISTLKELGPVRDYRRSPLALYDWLRDLIKASCDK